jgi:hypothetical protein
MKRTKPRRKTTADLKVRRRITAFINRVAEIIESTPAHRRKGEPR